ncbi:triose-phosphate transporter [Pseudoscourfieldia marina]
MADTSTSKAQERSRPSASLQASQLKSDAEAAMAASGSSSKVGSSAADAPLGSGADSDSVWLTVVSAYMYVIIWMTVSCSVILFNKWLLAYTPFHYPITLTLWHMAFCSTCGFIVVRVLKVTPSVNMSWTDYGKRVVPIGALYALSLWLSNSAYLYLSVSFIQMTKSLMPGLTFLVGMMAGRETYSHSTAINMTIIAVGVAVAAYGELNFVLKGVLMQLGALVFEAARLMLVQVLIDAKGMKMNSFQSLYYISPACGVCLLVPFYFMEYDEVSAKYSTLLTSVDPKILIANAATAFLLNLAVFLLIGKTSALTMNIAGVIKDWILIAASGYLFQSPITALNLAGYFVAFCAVCVYQYTKLQRLKQAAAVARKDRG